MGVFNSTDAGPVDLYKFNARRGSFVWRSFADAFAFLANFSGSDLRHVCFRGANLGKVNFRGADLRGVDFKWSILRKANFCGADLRGANFEGADLREADFDGARNVTIEGAAYTPTGGREQRGKNTNLGWKRGDKEFK